MSLHEKIANISTKMNIGISRSKKYNTWTMFHTVNGKILSEVFTGSASEFLEMLTARDQVLNG